MKKIEKPQEYYDLISEYNQMQKQYIELQAKMRESKIIRIKQEVRTR